jgi:GntR family transcriptional repressor for pyruvate dehydrogenase complex
MNLLPETATAAYLRGARSPRSSVLPFEKVLPEKLSQGVVRQIELLILEGILRPGERLPAERELSDRLGVSRPSLRDAVSELQDKGLLVSRAGSGIFVADVLGAVFSPALVRLFSEHERAMFDSLSFRRDVEGLAAERATRYGSDTDLAVIATIFDKMERAHMKRDPSDEAALDAEFHLAIVEASHNVIMLHVMRSMYDLLREGVFYNRKIMFKQKATRASILDQHRQINTALQARDGAAARRAIEAHMDFVERALSDFRRAEENEKIARRRLRHEQTR